MRNAMTTPGLFPSWGKSVAMWVFRALIAAVFIAAAGMKLTGQPMMVTEFDKIGFGQWFRVFTGALELFGALVLLAPRYSAVGALLLLAVDVGAFVAQVMVLHADWIHTIVIGAALVGLVYLQRHSFLALDI